jgi:hypothetical protein
MSDFILFKKAVAKQFAKMQDLPLFRTAVEKDALWETYLESFPPGTNNIFRERREYDCTCCKQFIRAVGDIVAIDNGKLVSIWDIEVGDPTFATVAAALSKLVKKHKVEDLFLHDQRTAGTDKTFDDRTTGKVMQWEHFHINIPQKFVKPKHAIATFLGEKRSTYDVALRGLRELTLDAADTILELIGQNSLYRGEEHKATVQGWVKLKKEFDKLSTKKAQDLWVWSLIDSVNPGARIRNSVIGTLLIDLSKGESLEGAVKAFEFKVAPANYKRPTALVTKSMIEDAKKKIASLGLTSALDRRYATLEDLKVTNILFADRSAKKKINGDVFDDLAGTVASKPKSLDKIEEITIDKFVQEVLPKADSIEVMFEGKHVSNLVSLVAPADPTAGKLFKWDNGFSWDYNGGMADSIKERVKQAGGNVTGDVCCRLAWYNHDDLDFHMVERPTRGSRFEIYYGTRYSASPNGGQLDVDMNAGHGTTREPVENIFYSNRSRMADGTYELNVHQFSKRETTNVGFDVEIDIGGDVYSFAYDKAVRQGETINVATLTKRGNEITVAGQVSASKTSKQIWGIGTNQFHKAKLMLLSPNHWDGKGVGNKHWFFVLEGAKNDGEARGFFNEFLNPELDKHRKVFEMVGSKMKAKEGADNQLSGLGFSSTQKDQLVVKVTGSFTRMLKIVF